MDAASLSLLFNGYAWWLILPLAAVLAAAIARLYRRETAAHGVLGARLRALRATVVALLILLLLQPVLQRVTVRYSQPLVVVLRDASGSMTVKDTHEPLECRVRAAVALGLLADKLRDKTAEDAAREFKAAEAAAETSAAGLRRALQLLQESLANTGNAREPVHTAANALYECGQDLRRGVKLLKDLKNTGSAGFQPANKGGQDGRAPSAAAEALCQTAQQLENDLRALVLDASGVRARLQEKSAALAGLLKDTAKLAADAKVWQDGADRALGESPNPLVKNALTKLATMDRAAIVAGMLDGQALRAANDRVRFVHYAFDTDLRELTSGQPGAAGRLADTDLATPLMRIVEQHAQDSIAAVVLCTDGRHTSGPAPEDAASVLAARGITVHTLGVGSLAPPPDICVARLEGTLSVFLEETIRLTAHVKFSGFKGQKCTLVLSRGDEVVQQRELAIGEDGWRQEQFELPANKPGPNVFTASIKPLPGEALTANNTAEAVVDVAHDKLKVLLVDELPRWETRYLASLLRRERKMTLDERWLLSGDNLGPKPRALPEDEKALEQYEIVILGDIAPERLNEAEQKRLAKFVGDQGGFLVLIAGPTAMPRAYPAGPLSELLPVKPWSLGAAAAPIAGREASSGARVKLDAGGAAHEITRILRDPALNEKLWPALPDLGFVMRPAQAKPGATPLLCTDDARKDVVVAVQYYGAGRVLYSGTDGTWNWRAKVGDRVHAFFWSQALRWGTGNRLVGDQRLKIGCDRRQIKPGENVEVLARPRGADGKPANEATVFAQLPDTTPLQRVQLQSVPGSGGLYRGVLQNLPAGRLTLRVQVESPGFEDVRQDMQLVVRELTGQEGIELTRDPARLAAIAKAGGGRYLDILEAPELVKQLTGQSKPQATEESYQLWSSYPILLLIVLLLALEWVLRKRVGLA